MVNITIINLQKKLPIRKIRIRNLILKILKGERAKIVTGYINICFTNNPLIKRLNAKFLKTSSSTDVLAFDLNKERAKKKILADIMISTDEAIKNAHNFKTTAGYELLLYVVHGVLHILGFDDQTKTQIKLMRKKEKEYVNR